MIEKVKEHFKKHKIAYYCFGTGVVTAGFTYILMRSVDSQHIRGAIGVPAHRAIGVMRESVALTNAPHSYFSKTTILNDVSYIAANRQGPPSWVVRCVETGLIFTSQKSAAVEMNLSASHISEQLNGVRDHVNNFTFERICMAA